MELGEYLYDRILPKMVADASRKFGIDMRTYSDDWIIRLQRDSKIRWVSGYKFDLNTSAASAIAKDKVATAIALEAAGVASIPHFLVRSIPEEPIHLTELARQLPLMSKVVLKPLEGSGAKGISLHENRENAQTTIAGSELGWALSPYFELLNEYRVIVLDDEILLTYEKSNPVMRQGLKLFNLGNGAKAISVNDPEVELNIRKLALQASASLSLRLAAVDVVRDIHGVFWVLEINDGIMFENYARQSHEAKQLAYAVYEKIIRAMFI